jgi:hypothetical protein
MREFAAGHTVACHFPLTDAAAGMPAQRPAATTVKENRA